MNIDLSEKLLDAIDIIEVNLTKKGTLRADIYDVDGHDLLFGKGMTVVELNQLFEAYKNKKGLSMSDLVSHNILSEPNEIHDYYDVSDNHYVKIKILTAEKAAKLNISDIDSIKLDVDANDNLYAIVHLNGGKVRINSDAAINALLGVFYANGYNGLFDLSTAKKLTIRGDVMTAYESKDGKTFTKRVATATVSPQLLEFEIKADGTVTGKLKYTDASEKNVTTLAELNAALDSLYALGYADFAALQTASMLKFTPIPAEFEMPDNKHISKKLVNAIDKIDIVEYDPKADGTITGTIKYKDGTTKPLADINEVNNTLDLFYAAGFANLADLIKNGKVKAVALDPNVFNIPDGKHIKAKVYEVEKIKLDVKSDGTIVGKIIYVGEPTKDTSDLKEINAAIANLSAKESKNLNELVAADLVAVSKRWKERYDIKNNKEFEAISSAQLDALLKAKKKKTIIRLICAGVIALAIGYLLMKSGHPISDDRALTGDGDDDSKDDPNQIKSESLITVSDQVTFNETDEEALLKLAAEQSAAEAEALRIAAEAEASKILTVSSNDENLSQKPLEVTFNEGSSDEMVQGLVTTGNDSHYITASGMNSRYTYDHDNQEYNYLDYGCLATDEMNDQLEYVFDTCIKYNTPGVELENTVVPEDRLPVATFRKMRDEVYANKRSVSNYNDWAAKYLYEGETVINGVELPPYSSLHSYPQIIITEHALGNNAFANGYESSIGQSYYNQDTLGNSLLDEYDMLKTTLLDSRTK